jgi:hypothetical protein
LKCAATPLVYKIIAKYETRLPPEQVAKPVTRLFVKNDAVKSVVLLLALLVFLVHGASLAQEPPEPQPPDNVEGKWTIHAHDPDGSFSTKYVEIKQNGALLTGHFKGPHQSGGIEGTVNVHHIVFRTKTRDVLTFRGRIEGNTMSGNFGNRGRHGTWIAERTN